MLENGFNIANAHVSKPKSIGVATTILSQISSAVASAQYGGQTMSHIDHYLAQYAEATYEKNLKFCQEHWLPDAETVAIAEMVLVGKINTEIVSLLNRHGAKAVGLSGKDADLIIAKKHFAEVHDSGTVKTVDIGFVGDVEHINTDILNALLDRGYTPVIAPIGVGRDNESYNINADYVAGEVAGALGAEKLIMLTDVEGIYRDYHDKSSFISTLSLAEAQEMIKDGTIGGGMIPKVETCIKALQGGTGKTHIIDGRQPHSILLEIFTAQGIGTQVVK